MVVSGGSREFDSDVFRLDEACANFYVLERVVTTTTDYSLKQKTARYLSEYESLLARHISGYFEYAVTTELDYLEGHTYVEADQCECVMYEGCNECWNCECPQDYCGGPSNCEDCECEEPSEMDANEYGLSPLACDMAQGYMGMGYHWDAAVEHHGRAKVLEAASACFSLLPWESGYGGEGWALIAEITSNYLAGKMKRRTFIDRAWTMKHNGGVAFDKAEWHGEGNLYTLLELQAEGKYGALVAWSSKLVKALWYIGNNNQTGMEGRDPVWLGRFSDITHWQEVLEREEW